MKKKLSISSVSVTVIVCIFAVSILGTLLFGVSIYKNVQNTSSNSYDSRVCVGYITSKIRAADVEDMVYVTTFNDLPALCIDDVIEDSTYHTMVYAYDGKLREINYPDGLQFNPEDGEEITDVVALDFSQRGHVITVKFKDSEGTVTTGTVYVRSGEVAK